MRDRMKLPCAAMAAALAILLSSSDTRAEPSAERFRLVWIRGDDAASCPGQEYAARRIVERLGRDPFAAEADWTIEVALRRKASTWRGDVVLRDALGRSRGGKTFESGGDDCRVVAEAATLAVALAVDEYASEARAREERPRPPAARVAPPLQPSEKIALTSAAATMHVFPGWSLMPGVPLGIANETRLGLGTHRRSEAYVMMSALWVPFAPAHDRAFTFGLTAFGAGGCAITAQRGRIEMLLCGQVLVGAPHTVVRSLQPLDPEPSPWGALALGHRLTVRPFGALILDLGVDAVVPLTRRSFRVFGTNQLIYEQRPIAFLPFIGAGVAFY